jgi:hypothetical protein
MCSVVPVDSVTKVLAEWMIADQFHSVRPTHAVETLSALMACAESPVPEPECCQSAKW